MDNETQEMRIMIEDLALIKKAVTKGDSFLRFINAGGALREILLIGGVLITIFSTVIYFLIARYEAYGAIPPNFRLILFVLIGLSAVSIGFLKNRNFIRGARLIGIDMSFYKLLQELYEPRILTLVLPNIAVIILAIIFLVISGNTLYIVSVLAVLYGLLVISLSTLLFLKEFYFLGLWLTATGMLSIFTAELIHPLFALVITFATGFVLTSLLLYWGPTVERDKQ